MRTALYLSCSVLLWAGGCDDTVNPNAPFQPRIVVYAILNTGTDRQLVRTFAMSEPPNINIGGTEPPVTDATVTIAQQNTVYRFRDTTIARKDTSRYSAEVQAKVAAPFRPEYGSEYVLKVESPAMGTYAARTRIPRRGIISSIALFILQTPDDYKYGLPLELKLYGKGYVLRMLLQYEVEINGIWFEQTEEVPRSLQGRGQTRNLYPVATLVEAEVIKFKWPLETLTYTISEVMQRYEANHIIFKRVVLQLRQYEENLFNYYQVVNGFRDPRSIRVDLPDYTNIPGGLGVFGAYTIEELVYELPPDFIRNR